MKEGLSEPGYYVLPKTMAYDVINSNTDRLAETLSVQRAEDIESFAHILHAAHPVVDSLICKSGTRIVVKPGSWATMHGKIFEDSEELGRDCSGVEKREQSGLGSERSPGLVFTVSAGGRGMWPLVSKTARWSVLGASSMEDWDHDWGRSEEERRDLVWGSVTFKGDGPTEKQTPRQPKRTDGTYYTWWIRLMGPVRSKWLAENPTWWDEKRGEAEVYASPQVAGEMTDMNLENKTIVAGHLAKSIEGGEVV